MTFKPNLPAGACPALVGASVLVVAGPQAAAFLQAQLMNDVAALVPGRWQWSGWLSPKGRVLALFLLLRTGEQEFLVVSPDVPAAALAEQLRRFVFRSKLVLAADGSRVAAAGPAVAFETADVALAGPSGEWALDLGGADGGRTLWLLPAGHPALAAPDPATDAAWRATDLAHGLPRLSGDQLDAWTPQMLSLDRLGAYSVRKGCYPGQEIVARTHFLGQAKRGLARLAGNSLAAGQAVESGGQAVGTVVCAGADGREALAVLANDAPGPLAAAGHACRRQPLLDGLRRPR